MTVHSAQWRSQNNSVLEARDFRGSTGAELAAPVAVEETGGEGKSSLPITLTSGLGTVALPDARQAFRPGASSRGQVEYSALEQDPFRSHPWHICCLACRIPELRKHPGVDPKPVLRSESRLGDE